MSALIWFVLLGAQVAVEEVERFNSGSITELAWGLGSHLCSPAAKPAFLIVGLFLVIKESEVLFLASNAGIIGLRAYHQIKVNTEL